MPTFKQQCIKTIEDFKKDVENKDTYIYDKLCEIIVLMDEWMNDIDYSEKEGWEACSGCKTDDKLRTHTLYMCGGCADWYDYRIDRIGRVCKINACGIHELKEGTIVYTDEEGEYVMLGDNTYDMAPGELNLSEMVMDDMFD
jgi:hypothetical protein